VRCAVKAGDGRTDTSLAPFSDDGPTAQPAAIQRQVAPIDPIDHGGRVRGRESERTEAEALSGRHRGAGPLRGL
jgi:hypothetical protein